METKPEWVKVGIAFSHFESLIMRDLLRAEGIDAEIWGIQDANSFVVYRGDTPQFIDIFAPQAQSDEAKIILQSLEKPAISRPPLLVSLYVAAVVAGFVFYLCAAVLSAQLAFFAAIFFFVLILFANRRFKT